MNVFKNISIAFAKDIEASLFDSLLTTHRPNTKVPLDVAQLPGLLSYINRKGWSPQKNWPFYYTRQELDTAFLFYHPITHFFSGIGAKFFVPSKLP